MSTHTAFKIYNYVCEFSSYHYRVCLVWGQMAVCEMAHDEIKKHPTVGIEILLVAMFREHGERCNEFETSRKK